jgi:hypothetical protein
MALCTVQRATRESQKWTKWKLFEEGHCRKKSRRHGLTNAEFKLLAIVPQKKIAVFVSESQRKSRREIPRGRTGVGHALASALLSAGRALRNSKTGQIRNFELLFAAQEMQRCLAVKDRARRSDAESQKKAAEANQVSAAPGFGPG